MTHQDARITQVTETLRARYFPMIPPLQQNWTPEQHDKNRLSRSLAAFAIEKLADVAQAPAVYAVIDGGDDNGIDAICYDQTENILWLVQAKAGNAPNMGENKKFCDGIRDLVYRRFHRFNTDFTRLQADVTNALDTHGLNIIGTHIYLDGSLGRHVIADLQQLKTELNQFHEQFSWQDCPIACVHGWLADEHAVALPPITLTLENWNAIRGPRRMFYGIAAASELSALYHMHEKKLFERNIRHYLGTHGVNDAIVETVRREPAQLLLLNNGLTAVCTSIVPPPGPPYQTGSFALHGFSIVNGAQTVGALASVFDADGTIAPEAKIHLSLIEVGDANACGALITRARNTQNAIRGLDFAALDPNQERLRRELAISGIIYYYRPSAEARRLGPNEITIEQAAIALACFSGETRTVVAAKHEISAISDPQKSFYPTLFTAQLTGVYLCRAVRIYTYLDGIFSSSMQAETDEIRRAFYRHGRYFILHILARRRRDLLDKPELTVSADDQATLSREALDIAELIYIIAEARFSRQKGYLSIFRNLTDASPLAQDTMRQLAQRDAQLAMGVPATPPQA